MVASSQPEDDEDDEELEEEGTERQEEAGALTASPTLEWVLIWLFRRWLRVPIRGTTRRPSCGGVTVVAIFDGIVDGRERRCCRASAAASSSAVGMGGSGRFGGGPR